MCAKFGCGPTVVSKKGGGGYRQTDRQTDRQRFLQLYIVDNVDCLVVVVVFLLVCTININSPISVHDRRRYIEALFYNRFTEAGS